MIELILGVTVLVAIGWLLVGPIAFIVMVIRQRDLQSQLRMLRRRVDAAEERLRHESGAAQSPAELDRPPVVPGCGPGEAKPHEAVEGRPSPAGSTIADIMAASKRQSDARAADEIDPLPDARGESAEPAQPVNVANEHVDSGIEDAHLEADIEAAKADSDQREATSAAQVDAIDAEAANDREQVGDESREAARDRLLAREATSPNHEGVEASREADEADKASVDADRPMSFEEMLAGRWTAWIGGFTLIVGAGFFFRYAIEQGWIGPAVRVALGLLTGTALYVGGVFAVRKRYEWMSQGLVGASLGVLYFSLYAACRWFEPAVMPDALAFAGMCLATIACFAFAGVFNARATAVLALVGGLLTPILLSTGSSSHWAFFSYLLMLNLGALGVATIRKWPLFNMLVFASSLMMWVGWMEKYYAPLLIAEIAILMSAFFALFALLGVWHQLIRKSEAKAQDFSLIFAAPLSYFGGLLFLTWSNYSHWQGYIAMAMAMLYVVLAVVAVQRDGLDRKIAFAFGGIATLFATVAIPLQFSGHWITIGWAVEAIILFEMGVRFRDRWLSRAGLLIISFVTAILGLYALRTFIAPGEFTTFLTPEAAASKSLWLTTPLDSVVRWFDVFNARSFTFLASIVALGLMAWETLSRCKPDDDDANIEAIGVTRPYGMLFRVLASWLVLAMVVVETYAMWARLDAGPAALLVLFAFEVALFALVMFQAGVRLNGGWLTRSAMAGIGLLQLSLALLAVGTLVKPATFTTYFVSSGAPELVGALDVINARLFAFVAGIATMGFIARGMLRKCEAADAPSQLESLGIAEKTGRGLLSCSLCMIYVMLAVETFAYWSRLNGSLPVLFAALAIEAVALGLAVQLAGVLTKQRWFEWLSTCGYAIAAVLCILNFGQLFLTWHRFSEQLAGSEDGLGVWGLPLVNPRGLGFLVTLAGLVAAAVYSRRTRDGDEQLVDDLDQVCGLAAVVLGWLYATGETYAWGVAHDWGSGTSLAVTLVWTMYAVGMLLGGIFIRSGGLRIMSLALFGLTTAKVFLVDIWQLDTTIRTFAFMGLGAALMLVSWLYRRYRARIHEWIAADKSAADSSSASSG